MTTRKHPRSAGRSRRRQQRRLQRYYRHEHPLVLRLKQIGIGVFIAAGTALLVYALFFAD